MSKPTKIEITDKDYFAWEYEEQTKIKHQVLGAYIKVWITKLGSLANTLFIDCHGGCGAYRTNNDIYYGSSFLVEQIASQVNEKRTSKNGIYVCEIDKENCDNLIKVRTDLDKPKMIVRNCDFNDLLCDEKVIKFYQNNPTFFFVDPFGFDLKMSNLAGIMDTFGNEIVVNFMFDYINRFLELKSIENTITDFFGNDEWKKAIHLKGKDRETFLVGLYKTKLKETVNAKFVFAYRLCYPNRDRTYYYLFHATNHIDGITNMKNSFASINNGRVEYLGKKNNQFTLFDLESFKLSEAQAFLISRFVDKHISFKEIWELVVEDTSYLEKELRAALQDLETQSKITVQRVDSKKTGLKGKDIIIFGGVK